jgi:hypothetical protein
MEKAQNVNASILLLILLFLPVTDCLGQESLNGYWFPARDTLRIFIVYAEVANDPDDPVNIRGWKAGALPPDPGYLFDHSLPEGVEPRGILTRYYYQASFGKYIVLADHYPGIVTLDYDRVQGNGVDQVLAFLNAAGTDDIVSEHGYSVNKGDFDFISTSRLGQPKRIEPDSLLDILMVIWRVNSKMTRDYSAGFCATNIKMHPIKAMKGMNSYSCMVDKDYTHYHLIRHEFSHLLLGGNNFHTGGAGAGTKTFMSEAGGYAMLSSYLRSSPVYCAFDRRRLGWKPSENLYQISARDPASGNEINADLIYGQAFSHGSDEFVLRDFVRTGDAIRIELPYLQVSSDMVNKQWLWLENHQKEKGNIDHEKATRKGLYAYIQVGKETLSGPGTYGGNCNYTWPVSAFGNYDFRISEENQECIVRDDLSNPFTGYNNLILGAYDLGEKDEIIYRNEVFLAKNIKINGEYPDSSDFNLGTYPLFGTSMDAFQPGNKIGIDRNPAAVPVLTYQTPASVRARPQPPVPSDNRVIHLNGISVEFLDQFRDGSIKLRIRWDDTGVGKDVRWCGDVQLHEELFLERGKKILLDQGLTPQRPVDPVMINEENIFADPTSLTVNQGAGIVLGRRSKLVIENKSGLILEPGSSVFLGPRAKIMVRDSSRLVIHPGAEIMGRGKILLDGNSSMETDENERAPGVKVRSLKR